MFVLCAIKLRSLSSDGHIGLVFGFVKVLLLAHTLILVKLMLTLVSLILVAGLGAQLISICWCLLALFHSLSHTILWTMLERQTRANMHLTLALSHVLSIYTRLDDDTACTCSTTKFSFTTCLQIWWHFEYVNVCTQQTKKPIPVRCA